MIRIVTARRWAEIVGSAAMIASIAGCGSPQAEDAQPVEPGREAADARPSTTGPEPVPAPDNAARPAPAPVASSVDRDDACGASKVAPWIGKEATIPVRRAVVEAAGPEADRWLYPDSVVTQDYRPDRLNVTMEKGTDIIVEADCG